MRKVLFTILFLTLANFSQSQSQKFFDAPFGGGGGFTPSFYFTNFDAVNSLLKVNNFPEFESKGVFTTGGGGYIYIGFVKYLRIGGQGFGGITTKKFSIGGTNYQVDYSIGGGGVTIEYTLPFIKDIGVSLGAMIGGSNLTLEIFRNVEPYSWNDLFASSQQNNLTRISKSSWTIAPILNIDYPIYRFIAIRLGGGYLYSTGGSWKANNGVQISDVPDKLNNRSFFIQLGLFGGFFSF